MISLLIAIPFYLSNYQVTFINSLFEGISGVTGTGFSIFKDINEGLVKKMFDTAEIFDILKMRVQQGIKAKLEITKWRK